MFELRVLFVGPTIKRAVCCSADRNQISRRDGWPIEDVEKLYLSHSEEETIRIARHLVAELEGGTTILLFGELGAGKTAFVRGLVEGAGGNPDDVSSPTFTLLQPYKGRLTVHHVDLYRVTPFEVDELGLDELATPLAIVAIEWADRLPRVPVRSVAIHIDDQGADKRQIRIDTSDFDIEALDPVVSQ